MSETASSRSWLILAHGFNMDGRASSLTITDKIPHLMAAGIKPIVVSAVTGQLDKRFAHHQVLPWGPQGLRFDLRHLVAMRFGRGVIYRLLTGSLSLMLMPLSIVERILIGLQSQWSWMPAAVFRGLLEIRRARPEVIYSTGGAYSAHWAGYWLKKLTSIPWIAEIHDPMIFPGTHLDSRNLKFQAKLEGMICREADLVWWFTEGALNAAQRRHPELGARGRVIYPGAEPPKVSVSYEKGQKLVLAHFGSLSSMRSLKAFVELFAVFKERYPREAADFEMNYYGGRIDPEGEEAIKAHKLDYFVKSHGRLEIDPTTGRTGRERIQEKMHQADALLLVHGTTLECAEYIPSKWYDYLWTGRPVFALTHLNPIFQQMIEMHGGYAVEVEDREQCLQRLYELHDDWRRSCLKTNSLGPIGVDKAVCAILEALKEQEAESSSTFH